MPGFLAEERMSLPSVYVFDIDGTLSDCEHRTHYLRGPGPKNWDAFFAGMADDAPIEHMARLCQELYPRVVFATGRPEEHRKTTLMWLRRYVGSLNVLHGTCPIYMRKTGDYRDDSIVKIELIEAIRADGYEVIMAFEDRKRVVDAYRAAGIPTAQIAPGDF
jgi:hypothetical protein